MKQPFFESNQRSHVPSCLFNAFRGKSFPERSAGLARWVR
jgi:hypothetical protein